jgi:pimeloyl-ACP methyl ester carboxylesterase
VSIQQLVATLEQMMLPNIAKKQAKSVEGRPYPVIAAGDGPLVVCLHGFPDNYESFQYQIEPFVAAGYRVVCPVLPGYAPGTEPVSGTNTPVYAADKIIAVIEVLLKESGEQQCRLVGHDWGALTACLVANQRPELLKSLAVLSIPYNINLQRVILRCPTYAVNGWYVMFFQLKWFADWWIKRNNWKFIDLLYRLWCPTWDNYEHRLVSTKETFKQPGVLKHALSYYRNCLFGLNPISFRWRRLYNGRIEVPTLALRGEVDGCMPEKAWEMNSAKSFRKGITLEVLPGIGHFPQLENPDWVSERLIRWFKQV